MDRTVGPAPGVSSFTPSSKNGLRVRALPSAIPRLGSAPHHGRDDMPDQPATGYLPGDPRYGLQGEALKAYYRTKLAQWAIYCWNKPGTAETQRALLPEHKK